MYHFFLIMFLIISIILIVLIMLHQNDGNSIGGIFNNRGLNDMLNSGSFNDNITRIIVILAILFFLISLVLGNMNSKSNQIRNQYSNNKDFSTHR